MECDLQQGNTEEYIDGQFTGNLGEILISFDIRLSEAYVTIHVYLPQLYLTPIEKATLLLNEPLALYATTHRYGGINSELILKKKYVVGSVCKLSADAPMFSTVMEFRRIKR
ncbi:hypothetical protein NC653_016887 [Populus alba x Populus x berolinensis]|uniref:Uncharacterized protein n=1 Tax=Populus alba x Populus x berolinensis TaxID=444605 RepID=A0AAD6VZS5_9ROSI|nr:hypothetical protein NC653_016887 [Populus alba x Populus x berolinensis]